MEDALLKKGRLVDELQLRIRQLKQQKKVAPDSWHKKLAQLAETNDPKVIDSIYQWSLELPALELQTEKITWDTYKHFAGHLSDRIVLMIVRKEILDGKKPKDLIDALKKLEAIPKATDDPIVAVAEYKQVAASISDKYPRIDIRGA